MAGEVIKGGITTCCSTCIQVVCYMLQAGKLRKMKHEQQKESDGLGVNVRSIVTVAVIMLLLMFAVHCTWVTSNAYSSPSIVLASYIPDGWGSVQIPRPAHSLPVFLPNATCTCHAVWCSEHRWPIMSSVMQPWFISQFAAHHSSHLIPAG